MGTGTCWCRWSLSSGGVSGLPAKLLNFFHTNTVSTSLLYEVIVEKSLPVRKVVVASSQSVYGEGKYSCKHCTSTSNDAPGTPKFVYPKPRPEAQLKEGAWDIRCPDCNEYLTPEWSDEKVVNPHNQYSISKYTQELVSLNLGERYGIPTTCMRYSIVQGSRQSFKNAYFGVLRIFTQLLFNGKAHVCYEDGQQIRDYVSVKDVACANLLAFEDERANYQVFNVGGDRKVAVQEYVHLIAHHAGVDIQLETPSLYRFGDTRHVFSDINKLHALGWSPTISLDEIIDEYIKWAHEQPAFQDYCTKTEQTMKSLGTLRTVTTA